MIGFSIVVSYAEQYMHLGNCMFEVTASARGNAYPLQQLHPVHVPTLLQQLHPVHVRRLTRWPCTCTGNRPAAVRTKQRPSKEQARTEAKTKQGPNKDQAGIKERPSSMKQGSSKEKQKTLTVDT